MEYFVDLILLFFAYSLLGWCIEVALKYRQFHRIINRGFFRGPLAPLVPVKKGEGRGRPISAIPWAGGF